MDWLRREVAPLTGKVWDEIENAVMTAARHDMAARRIADFRGPQGWGTVAVHTGRMSRRPGGEGGALLSLPEVILLTEIRAEFSLPWDSIEAYERGGEVLDTHAAEEAGRAVALAEDRLMFYGDHGFLKGEGALAATLGDWSNSGQADADILGAVEKIDRAGIPGPYDLVLDPDRYYDFQRATAQGGGYPVSRALRTVINKVFRSHVIKGGAVFSTRGEDFFMYVGGDLSVGYRWHDREAVHLFCAETVAAQLVTPEAVCVLGAS